MIQGLNGIECCRQEGVCPKCGYYGYETRDVYPLECSMYKLVNCSHCTYLYVIPYLIEFDEERPDNEMIVDFFVQEKEQKGVIDAL